jgi:hypothetical protein
VGGRALKTCLLDQHHNLLAIAYVIHSAAIQEKIIQAVVRTKREKASQLRSEAESEWEEAKQSFERRLLGEE